MEFIAIEVLSIELFLDCFRLLKFCMLTLNILLIFALFLTDDYLSIEYMEFRKRSIELISFYFGMMEVYFLVFSKLWSERVFKVAMLVLLEVC